MTKGSSLRKCLDLLKKIDEDRNFSGKFLGWVFKNTIIFSLRVQFLFATINLFNTGWSQ